ncbi:MAG: EamA family transporter [Bacteroidota bacterium]
MIYLLLSILSSVVTVSFFKLFQKFHVNTFHAIIINYLICVLMGNITSGQAIILTPFWQEPWFIYAFFVGVLFITIFYCIGETAQKMGVSVSMVSAKLSVVIPVLFAFFFHNETLGLIKIIGILISLFAVYFISIKNDAHYSNKMIWLPVLVFIGSGFIDTLLKHIESTYIPPASASSIVSTAFLVAFILGSAFISIKHIQQKQRVEMKNIYWGIALGIPNYFSMFFLVKTLENFSATYIFPINNIGIVAGSTIISLLFFAEKLSRKNIIGLALAIVSIIIISFSDVVF